MIEPGHNQPLHTLAEALTRLLRCLDRRIGVRGQGDGFAHVARLWLGRAPRLVMTPPAVGSFGHWSTKYQFACIRGVEASL
jgi:hypothetical protein